MILEPTIAPPAYEEQDLVSIVMPAYNCADCIGESIASCQAQSWQNWELIIMDDCSTDNTAEVVAEYQENDARIRYFTLAENSGAAVARTRAMRIATGRYIAFLDSDDLWHPEKLTRQIYFMQTNLYDFSCTDYSQIDEAGRPTGKVIKCKPKANYNDILLTCPVGNSTVIYDVASLGKFEVPNIRKRNDDALWLQILKKTRYIYGLSETLMFYRIRESSLSHNKWDLVKYHWKLYREIEHLSVLRSAFHIACWGFIKLFGIK
ncbi:MAG TPA: glycosyltransferase family 2 protein [Clostridiaceae bacterium]|nr:glycosyltransferase family 2 protein [Clostridiaceae bacterium]